MKDFSTHSDGLDAHPAAGEMLEQVLRQAGFDARRSGVAVYLSSGLRLAPVLLERHVLEDGRVAVMLRIVAFHDTAFPSGLPEVLHAAGASVEQAMAQGFAAWAQGVLPVLGDAVGPQVQACTLLAINLPGQGVDRVYQAVLGPILHLDAEAARYGEDEASCPACMTTRMQDLLRDRLPESACTGLALVAGRDATGQLIADCRLNGERFAEGAGRLLAYAQSWPGTGLEIRSQYVIIRPAPGEGASEPRA